MSNWVPLLIALPLLAAAFLLGVDRIASRKLIDSVAVLTSAAVALIAGRLALHTAQEPIVYWFGGWLPEADIVPGIVFVVDFAGVALAALAALLAAAVLLYSWYYFEAVRSLYHALILIFLAGMIGFSLSGDLFNLFVFFELMSVAGYALTAYQSEAPGPLQGALNFAITNSVGGILLLFAIAFLYGRTGTLNLAHLGQILSGSNVDGLLVIAFTLLIVGFMVKAAILPFHFAHADAHTVAPTPVLVLFSGVMSQLGIYGIARVYWAAFDGILAAYQPLLASVLVIAGAFTALAAAALCFAQHNLKRLLAFSTISHTGLFLIGVALFSPEGLAGTFLYIVAHGMIKGALFLCVGILLHHYGTILDLDLYGRARRLRPTAILFVLGGFGLAGLPPFGTYLGKTLIEASALGHGYSWLPAVFIVSSAITGAAVLRAAGLIFAGWGPRPRAADAAESGKAETERETKEEHGRTPAVMLAPVLLLIVAALVIGIWPDLAQEFEVASAHFQAQRGYQRMVLDVVAPPPATPAEEAVTTSGGIFAGLLSATGAVGLALLALFRQRLPQMPGAELFYRSLAFVHDLHSGQVGDYVAWLVFGSAIFGAVFTIVLR